MARENLTSSMLQTSAKCVLFQEERGGILKWERWQGHGAEPGKCQGQTRSAQHQVTQISESSSILRRERGHAGTFYYTPLYQPTTTTADAHFTKGNCESLGNFLYVKKEIRQRYLYIKKDKPKIFIIYGLNGISPNAKNVLVNHRLLLDCTYNYIWKCMKVRGQENRLQSSM